MRIVPRNVAETMLLFWVSLLLGGGLVRLECWLNAHPSAGSAPAPPPVGGGSILMPSPPHIEKSVALYIKITDAAKMRESQMRYPAEHYADIVIDFEGQKVEMTFAQFKAAIFDRACGDAHQE